MDIEAKYLPQLLVYGDEKATQVVRDLAKVPVADPNQILDVGVQQYESTPRLDEKAFRYVVKDGKMYLRESVLLAGGMVENSVLVELGEFTVGTDQEGAGLAYLAQVKDAKAQQQKKQLRENEKLARQACRQIERQVTNAEVLRQWQQLVAESDVFVRPGVPDYFQARMFLVEELAPADETLAKILVDYQTKLNAKNEKWRQPLVLGKAKETAGRIGTAPRKNDIGIIDPTRREEFQQYYLERAGQMDKYLQQADEVVNELPVPPEIIYDRRTATPEKKNFNASQQHKAVALDRFRHAFGSISDTDIGKNTTDSGKPARDAIAETEMSR